MTAPAHIPHGRPRRRAHLAAHFPGVGSTTVWPGPRSGSQICFTSFRHLARTAERRRSDLPFLAKGLRQREPCEPARRPATLDHLSEGGAAWNVATTSAAEPPPQRLPRQVGALHEDRGVRVSGPRAASACPRPADRSSER
ncbi:hypothetical protein ACQPZZ_17240 [Microbispora sp. CA-135349]|uniref:hypothetical protein n=1 Tax=Microbispora sp. CA-135349 TaxID=3239953 RepID=UPI003D8F3DCA